MLQPYFMRSFLQWRYGKTAVRLIMTIVLCITVTNVAAARSKRKSSPIQITWSNSSGVIAVFKVSPAQTDWVKVQLVSGGRTIDTDTKAWAGGIDGLLALAERASREKGSVSRKVMKGKRWRWRRLTVSYSKGVARHSFSFEGEIDELFAFFYGATDLRELLRLVSGDAPKAYRLINEGDGTMTPPEKKNTKCH